MALRQKEEERGELALTLEAAKVGTGLLSFKRGG